MPRGHPGHHDRGRHGPGRGHHGPGRGHHGLPGRGHHGGPHGPPAPHHGGPHHRGGHHGPPHHRPGSHDRSRSNSPDSSPERGSCRNRERCNNFVRYRRVTDGGQTNPGVPDPQVALAVKDCDLKIVKNTKLHHTDEYQITQTYRREKLVVRRGQPFDIELELTRPYDRKADDLRIVFELGNNPIPSKGTEVEIILSEKDEAQEWGAKILAQQGNILTVTIFTPPTCFVGKWGLNIDVIKKNATDTKVFSYEHDSKIYIIFNPWCKNDDTYMEDDKCRSEYVLNETGRVFRGSKNNISAKPWNFGQFEDPVLDVALHLLDLAGLQYSSRGHVSLVARKLSAAVNSSDDGGVLVGNWSGKYYPHRTPSSWCGSVEILRKFWRDNAPVKYGQCWVFSGVLTTIGRTLGIPSRSVTNFASAHDTDGSITIDMHYDEGGNPLDNDDSVWNFHVWNECWFARTDLPIGYGGWQAIDATPQEASGGVYCCGPVSVAAIKEGNILMPHDAAFVFAEVNADKVFWQWDANNMTWRNAHIKKNEVGINISTKAVGSDEREDVTLSYKPPEGSAMERACVMKANQLCSNRKPVYDETPQDVEFSITQDEVNSWVGDPFKLEVRISNTSHDKRTINGRVVVKTMYYTGVPADILLSKPIKDLVVGKGKCEVVKYEIPSDDYVDKLKDCCMIDVNVLTKVEETCQTYIGKEDYTLRKPELKVKCPNEATKGIQFTAELSFTNPLDVSMTSCVVNVDGLTEALSYPQKNVGPRSTFVTEVPVTPFKLGQKELIFTFGSTQLDDLNAHKKVFVRAPKM